MADQNDQPGQPDIKGLRDAAERGSAALKENDQLRRELLFARAGIDTDTKIGKMLFRTFEGETLDELKAEATELGILGGAQTPPPPTSSEPGTPTQTPDPNADLRGQQQFRQQLTGAPPAAFQEGTPDPMTNALEDYFRDRTDGVPAERARLAAFDKIWVAAVAGDQRVIFDPDAWAAQAR